MPELGLYVCASLITVLKYLPFALGQVLFVLIFPASASMALKSLSTTQQTMEVPISSTT